MTHRNYRELTEAELSEIEQLYPVTANRQIVRMYGISLDALTDRLAKPRGWKKDYKSVLVGNRNGKSLGEKEIAWIITHYKHTKNADIMCKFGIGESTLHRIARKHGLRKSRQFMRKTQQNCTNLARNACREYGLYDELSEKMRKKMEDLRARGERIPGSFMPGESNRDRLSPRRFRTLVAKSQAKRNESIRKDRLRLRWGLPQLTRIKLYADNSSFVERRRKAVHRTLFRYHGYIVDRGSNVIYYDNETDRSAMMESRAHLYGLTIEPAEDCDE